MSNGNGKLHGTIKWFSETKGYGFIKMDDNSPDVFVHVNELRGCGINRILREGDQVSFVLDKRPKGPYATQISLTGAQS